MTLSERYADLTIPFTLFGRTTPPVIDSLSIESLNAYADKCISSNIPLLKSVGFEVKRNICSSGNDLNGNI